MHNNFCWQYMLRLKVVKAFYLADLEGDFRVGGNRLLN